MTRLLRDVRLVPIVLIAAIGLFTLKALGLLFEGGYTLGALAGRDGGGADITGAVDASGRRSVAPVPAAPARPQSWAQQMFNFPEVTGAVSEATPAVPEPAKPSAPVAKPQEPAGTRGWIPVPLDAPPQSPSERALLERLGERRTEIEARAREVEFRENLLKAAEKSLEGRLGELRDLEARVAAAVQQKDEAEASRFKNLVTMYENMKAKDAAKIFDRLDMKVLVEVSTQINPRRMSDILGQMSPEAAERLTVELAARARGSDKGMPADLPKIEGRPTGN